MTIETVINSVNSSKFLAGISILFSNLGGKYLGLDIDKKGEKFLSQPIVRRLIVFFIAFLASKDIITSLIITFLFIILVKEARLFEKEDEQDEEEYS